MYKTKKPILLVTIQSDYVARDFIESGVLSELQCTFNLLFVTGTKFNLDLNPYGLVVARYSMSLWRSIVWDIAFGLRHISALEPIIKSQDGWLQLFQRGKSRITKRITLTINWFGISGVLSRLLEHFLSLTVTDFFNLKITPDYALLPTGINDPFWDDAIALCRRKKIRSLTVTVNWDNIASKVFLQKPDFLGVWGEQGYLFARLLQKIPAKKIVTIGAPRFVNYSKRVLSKVEARHQLQLPQGKRLLLFAGCGVVFDEVSLVEEFEEACRNGNLENDLFLIYKPHPKRHKRAAEPILRPSEYRYVKVFHEDGLTSLEKYPVLFSAVEGVISPFSTMLLESALMGLPALALAYEDINHGEYPWNSVRMTNHIHPMLDQRWVVQCFERNGYLQAVRELLKKVGDSQVEEIAKQVSRFIIHEDNATYGKRVSDVFLRKISEN